MYLIKAGNVTRIFSISINIILTLLYFFRLRCTVSRQVEFVWVTAIYVWLDLLGSKKEVDFNIVQVLKFPYKFFLNIVRYWLWSEFLGLAAQTPGTSLIFHRS